MDASALVTLAVAAVTIGGGALAGYHAGRIDTNDRIARGKEEIRKWVEENYGKDDLRKWVDEIRKWVEENFVSRKEMLAEFRAFHSDAQLQNERVTAFHRENTGRMGNVESSVKNVEEGVNEVKDAINTLVKAVSANEQPIRRQERPSSHGR